MGKIAEAPRMRYGILGGSFDPPHVGHLVLAQEAVYRLRLERLYLVPAADPPIPRSSRSLAVRATWAEEALMAAA